jgi:hypothetical protein
MLARADHLEVLVVVVEVPVLYRQDYLELNHLNHNPQEQLTMEILEEMVNLVETLVLEAVVVLEVQEVRVLQVLLEDLVGLEYKHHLHLEILFQL